MSKRTASKLTRRCIPLFTCGVLALVGCTNESAGDHTPTSAANQPASSGPTIGQPPTGRSSTGGSTATRPTTGGPRPSSGEPTSGQQIAPPCVDGQVLLGADPMSPGLGHRGVRLHFWVPTASGPCTLTGYPGVDTGAGGPLVHATRTLRGYLGGLPDGADTPPSVVVDRDHNAEAVVEGVAFDAAGNPCPTYTDLQVTPPNTTATVRLVTTIDTCELQVHPVTEPTA